MSTVYLNGEYVPPEQANINVMDRGFMFADGVYEIIPVFDKKILGLKEHLRRLDNSLRNIYIDNPLNHRQWEKIFHTLVKDKYGQQTIYVQISRGISKRDYDIDICERPTVLAMCFPVSKKNYAEGIKAIVHQDIRWDYCNIKAITLLPNVILRHRAKLKGAQEAILTRAGKVSEGAASNVFIVCDDLVKTPQKTNGVLPGVTRDLVLKLLDTAGIKYEETDIVEQELRDADEIWVTSSTRGIVPVVQLDDDRIGDSGKPGALWGKVNQLYQQYKVSSQD